jgi:predicted metal-dependent enzyme (double-stranded beta helix superfamily)
MCDLRHADGPHPFGFLVDAPEIRALVNETARLTAAIADIETRVEALKPAFTTLLTANGWLPSEYASPDFTSGMGSGIGQYALYRAEDGSLTLFSLVIPGGAETPVHDHLAWGLIGVYRGRQHETVYRRLDDGHDDTRAMLEVSRSRIMETGEFYSLLPPRDDIHYVKTLSDEPSVSIHLLANDTACVWRHRFDPSTGEVKAFRSGYSNAPCPPERA